MLLDANVLVYAVNRDAPEHEASAAVVAAALQRRVPAVLMLQVLLEFYAVITHARRVQRPLDPLTAWEQVSVLRASLPVLDVPVTVWPLLDELVQNHRPAGGSIFDYSLAAQMRAHRIGVICTYNTADFTRFAGIEAVTPEHVLAQLGT